MTISLLVVSPAYSIREMLARYLPYNEFTVYTADSPDAAVNFLKQVPIDVALIELQLKQATGLDFVRWLDKHYPTTHPVVICEDEDEDLITLIRNLKAGFLIKDKLNLLQFRTKLHSMCQNKRGLTYEFNQISIFELVKLVSFSGTDYHLYLTSPQTRQEGLIYFGEGKVKTAMYGEMTGEQAFYEIMKMKRGLFSELQVMDSDGDELIMSSLDQLLANSALILDTHEDNEGRESLQVQLPPTHCMIVSEHMMLPTFLNELFRFHKDSVLVSQWAKDWEEVEKGLMDNPELLIFDVDMQSLKAKKVLEFIDGNYLDTRVILVGNQPNPALSHTLKHQSVMRFFLQSQLQELAELIESHSLSQHFSGELLDLNLFGVLQIFSYFNHARLLEVTDYFSDTAGQIFMNKGEVIHATYGDYIGRDALKKILQINYGVFRQEAYWEPVTKSLNIPFNRLMMYLSRFAFNSEEEIQRDLLLQSGDVVTISASNIEQLVQ